VPKIARQRVIDTYTALVVLYILPMLRLTT
jgi:hypothetical protein